MLIKFIKRAHSHFIKFPRRTKKAINSFTYNFITDISNSDLDWNAFYEIVLACLEKSMSLDIFTISNLELAIDISTGNYAVSFTAPNVLVESTYIIGVQWVICNNSNNINDESNIIYGTYPWDYLNKNYIIELIAYAYPLKETIKL